jgi:hypothetical protein
MIEKYEEIISKLEGIDETFSEINRVLKEIQSKINNVALGNKKVVLDFRPWMEFFSVDKSIRAEGISELGMGGRLPIEDFHNDSIVQASPGTSSVLKVSSPNNPFVETSESFGNSLWTNRISEKYNLLCDEGEAKKHECNMSDSLSESLIAFNERLLPEIFVKEKDIKVIYSYVSTNGGVTTKTLHKELAHIGKERLDLFVELLVRKRFLKMENGHLFA